MAANNVYDGFFDDTWDDLADKGRCDSLGGAEYRRVKAEWVKRGRPFPLMSFILTHANLKPLPLPLVDQWPAPKPPDEDSPNEA